MVMSWLVTLTMAMGADVKPKVDPNSVTSEMIQAAMTRGVDFLVGAQKPNGAWGGPTNTKGLIIYAPVPGAHHAFRAGSTGLALAGVLDTHDQRPEVQASIQKAKDWVKQELPKLRRADQTTTYNCWGHAFGLLAISRLYQQEKDAAAKAEWAKMAQDQVDLLNRYADLKGGWGYLEIDDLATQRPTGLPTSFTTGSVLLAMAEARDVMGAKLNPTLVEAALTSLRIQRTPDFVYTYSLPHHRYPRKPINRPAGSLGRSQVCNATMRKFGDSAVTDEVLDTWANRFIAREGFLDNGRKRPVPHEAPFSIAGYFYYYGCYYFSVAAENLPQEKKIGYAKSLAADLIEKQEKDGSWWDYPLYDYHQPYGTGFTLMALSWCKKVLDAKP